MRPLIRPVRETTAQRPHCLCCGVVIGAYEPVIAIEHGKARKTALAREPELVHHADTVLFAHSICVPADRHGGEWSTTVGRASERDRRSALGSRSAIQLAAASAIRVNGFEPTASVNQTARARDSPRAAPRDSRLRSGVRPRTDAAGSRVALLDADPELRGLLTGKERKAASRMMLRVHTIAVDCSDVRTVLAEASALGVFVLEGLLWQCFMIAEQSALRLLGPNDLYMPGRPPQTALPMQYTCLATAATRLALLDQKLLRAARRWPGITAGPLSRTARQAEHCAAHLAIAHLPRADDRLLAMMALLGKRWGHATPNGTVIPLALTHATLGGLIGSSRPSVTLALTRLARHDHLLKHDRGWLLRHEPLAPAQPKHDQRPRRSTSIGAL